jgi:hypothetical protein
VDAAHEDPDTEALDRAECLDLLSSALIGRISFTQGALPAVQPVAFAVVDSEVFIPTHEGSEVAAASRGAVLAMEVDEVDVRACTGWSVTVVGPSRLIVDADEVLRMDRLGVRPWATGPGLCYIGLEIRLVSGRRIGRRPSALDAPRTDSHGKTSTVLPA